MGLTRRGRVGALGLALVFCALPGLTPPAARARADEPSPKADDREQRLGARIRQLEALLDRMPSPENVREVERTVETLSGRVEELSTELVKVRAEGETGGSSGGLGPSGQESGGGSQGEGDRSRCWPSGSRAIRSMRGGGRG